MAMNVGGTKGGPVADMNVTPMIDVLLVLIIVFMLVTIQTKSTGLETQLPHPAEQDTPPPLRTVVVRLLDSGGERPKLMINREPVTWEELRGRLIEIYKTRAERVMFVQADRESRFEYVASVIDVARGDFQDMRVGLLTGDIGN